METRKERKLAAAQAATKPVEVKPKKVAAKAPVVDAEEVDEVIVPSRVGRKVSFPIRSGLCIEMTLPEDGLTLKELHRLGLFLYPYCTDIDTDHSPWTGLKH
jgi:hypothetical protein